MINFKENISIGIAKAVDVNQNEIYSYIELPSDSKMGDFALPCFKLAKTLKLSPVAIANLIQEKYKLDKNIDKVEAVNGYLNFFVNRETYIKEVISSINEKGANYGSSNEGKSKTVVIDYSSPNIAKPFHIGHLRTTVIGGALYKMYKFMGYNSIGINHIGDWGIQFGKVMAGISLWKDEYILEGTDDEIINQILKIYVRFNKEEETKPGYTDLARQWFIKLEQKDEEAVKLWSWIKEISLNNYQKVYDLLNIKFDSFNGEAFYNDKMDVIISELEDKNLLIDSQGAKVVMLDEYDMPPCIVLTSTGTTIYATRDLAAMKYRINEYKFDKLIYVVGGEQQLHFKQIFKVMELMGYEDAVKKSEHVSFGLVVGKDGQKIGTRKGNSVLLNDILNEAVNKSLKIIQDKNPALDNKEDIAKKVGVGAIIFNDLCNNRIKDEIFDWDDMLNFNGETGPYVQFMYVRTQSILKKSNIDIQSINKINYSLLIDDDTYNVIKLISNFENVLSNALNKNEPSILTRYIIDLAQAYSIFYTQCTVISEDIETTKARLLLTKYVGDIIKKGLELLGISCPEQM